MSEPRPNARKPESLRRRHLTPAHARVLRPSNPSVALRRRGSLPTPGARARRGGRSLLASLPWLGILGLLGAAATWFAGHPTSTLLLAGGGFGALLARPARHLVRAGDDPRRSMAPEAVEGVGAVATLGLGTLPGWFALGGWSGWGLGLAAALLGLGALALARDEPRGAWAWRAATGALLVLASALLVLGARAALDGHGLLLAVRLAAVGALALTAWGPLALLAVGLEADPSAERHRPGAGDGSSDGGPTRGRPSGPGPR